MRDPWDYLVLTALSVLAGSLWLVFSRPLLRPCYASFATSDRFLATRVVPNLLMFSFAMTLWHSLSYGGLSILAGKKEITSNEIRAGACFGAVLFGLCRFAAVTSSQNFLHSVHFSMGLFGALLIMTALRSDDLGTTLSDAFNPLVGSPSLFMFIVGASVCGALASELSLWAARRVPRMLKKTTYSFVRQQLEGTEGCVRHFGEQAFMARLTQVLGEERKRVLDGRAGELRISWVTQLDETNVAELLETQVDAFLKEVQLDRSKLSFRVSATERRIRRIRSKTNVAEATWFVCEDTNLRALLVGDQTLFLGIVAFPRNDTRQALAGVFPDSVVEISDRTRIATYRPLIESFMTRRAVLG